MNYNKEHELSDEEIEKLALEAMERDLIKLGFGLGEDSLSWQAEQRKIKALKDDQTKDTDPDSPAQE